MEKYCVIIKDGDSETKQWWHGFKAGTIEKVITEPHPDLSQYVIEAWSDRFNTVLQQNILPDHLRLIEDEKEKELVKLLYMEKFEKGEEQ